MELSFTKAALKELRVLPKADATRLRQALRQVAEAYPERMPFVTEMVGEPGRWRLRKGVWRAIYEYEHVGDRLVVVRVAKRGEAYQ